MKLMLKQITMASLAAITFSVFSVFSFILPGREQLKLDLDQRLLMSCHARSIVEHLDCRLSLAGLYLPHAC